MTCAIVETRINYQLHKIIEAHLEFIPDPDLYFFTTSEGYDFYSKRVEAKFVIIHSIGSLHAYNQLLTSYSFWEYLPKGHCLIFQADSMLLRDGIEDFTLWDYVGAPWNFQEHGGNGGLSLRNVEVMQDICRRHKYSPALGYEDVFFCNIMKAENLKLAPRNICRQFSCETIFELGTLGYHAIDKHLTKEQVHQIKTQYDN